MRIELKLASRHSSACGGVVELKAFTKIYNKQLKSILRELFFRGRKRNNYDLNQLTVTQN